MQAKKHNKGLNREIFRLTIPNIITNITVPFLGMVDTAVVGHITQGDNIDYIGAVAVGSMIFNFLYWGFGFLRMGTGGFTAQAYGAKDLREQIDTLIRALSIALSISLLIVLMQKPIGFFASQIIEDKNQVITLALEYFFIRVWEAPAQLSMYALKGWFIGMQDSKTPMIVAIVINVINILLDITFVMFLGLGIKGLAIATVISAYCGVAVICLIWLVRYRKMYEVSLTRALQFGKMKEFFRVGTDIFFRSACIIAVTTSFTVFSSSFAYPTLAVNTLIMQLFSLFSFFTDGVAYACESLCGKYYGAKDKDGLRQTVTYAVFWSGVLAVVFSLIYGFFSNDIFSLLTNNQTVINAGGEYRLLLFIIPLTSFLAFVYDGILVGMMQSRIMLRSVFLSVIVFFGVYFLAGRTVNALWLGFILYVSFRSCFIVLFSRKMIF